MKFIRTLASKFTPTSVDKSIAIFRQENMFQLINYGIF